MNPLQSIVARLGRRASEQPTLFRQEAEGILEGFRAARRDLEAKVKQGDLTPKVAREQAAGLATGLGQTLKSRAGDFSTAPRVFLDRLVEASKSRKAASERTSLEGLQRETNRLLRSVLIEQQIQVRKAEFESRAFVRPPGGGAPAPSLESLLAFHESVALAGDDAGSEWARRQLDNYRVLVSDPDQQRLIDLATDQPDRINLRIIETYIDAMKNQDPDSLERFVAESVAAKDANACMAAFVLAREATEGSRLRWVRLVLEGINAFPDVALTTLRELEAESRRVEREAALTQAEYVAAQAEAEARLHGLEAPTAAEVARRSALHAKPAAKLGEAIGLTLDRRGFLAGDEALQPTGSPSVG